MVTIHCASSVNNKASVRCPYLACLLFLLLYIYIFSVDNTILNSNIIILINFACWCVLFCFWFLVFACVLVCCVVVLRFGLSFSFLFFVFVFCFFCCCFYSVVTEKTIRQVTSTDQLTTHKRFMWLIGEIMFPDFLQEFLMIIATSETLTIFFHCRGHVFFSLVRWIFHVH